MMYRFVVFRFCGLSFFMCAVFRVRGGLLVVGPFQVVWCVCVCGGGGGAVCACGLRPKSRAPRFPRFILQVNFSDTLLVVSVLDMISVYDCHLRPLLEP